MSVIEFRATSVLNYSRILGFCGIDFLVKFKTVKVSSFF